MNPPTLLHHLKITTSDAHERLESSLDSDAPDFSIHDYRLLLRRLLGFIEPWEAVAGDHLHGAGRKLFDERRKTPLLKADLQWLGILSLDDVPTADDRSLPRVSCEPEAWGSWYVVEGSTLGGQLLSAPFSAAIEPNSGIGLGLLHGLRCGHRDELAAILRGGGRSRRRRKLRRRDGDGGRDLCRPSELAAPRQFGGELKPVDSELRVRRVVSYESVVSFRGPRRRFP
ncbi:MAG: biliverdin-producing heme oxygenase [Pirellulales bacterium]